MKNLRLLITSIIAIALLGGAFMIYKIISATLKIILKAGLIALICVVIYLTLKYQAIPIFQIALPW